MARGDSSPPKAGFLDVDEALWLFAAVRTTRAALPALLQARGSIVNVSSDDARRPATAPLPYGAAEAALNAFGKGISEEFGPQGVRVTTISPAATRTPFGWGNGASGPT